MKKPWWKKQKVSEGYKYKITLMAILEFLHRVPEEHFEWDKKHYSVKDYSLEQFQFYICKKIDENSQDDTI